MQRWSVFALILVGLLTGCAHSNLSHPSFVPPDHGDVSIEFEHGHLALASMILMSQPEARITLKEDATGRRFKVTDLRWDSEIEQLLSEQGMTLTDSPDGWTDYLSTTTGSGFDDIELVEFQLINVLPPLHWDTETAVMARYEEFPLLELVLCELSAEGSCTYSYDANSITVRDRADRIATIEELIAEEESFSGQ